MSGDPTCLCLHGNFVHRDGTPSHRYTLPECPIHGELLYPLGCGKCPPDAMCDDSDLCEAARAGSEPTT